MLQYIISILILTGVRKNEVFKAKWAYFNSDTMLWRAQVTKSGKARHVLISDGLLVLLQSHALITVHVRSLNLVIPQLP
jgi:integrase